jgi:hypothetical protein
VNSAFIPPVVVLSIALVALFWWGSKSQTSQWSKIQKQFNSKVIRLTNNGRLVFRNREIAIIENSPYLGPGSLYLRIEIPKGPGLVIKPCANWWDKVTDGLIYHQRR